MQQPCAATGSMPGDHNPTDLDPASAPATMLPVVRIEVVWPIGHSARRARCVPDQGSRKGARGSPTDTSIWSQSCNVTCRKLAPDDLLATAHDTDSRATE